MRGIDGALAVLRGVREGRFASEMIRSLGAEIPAKELTLASSLAYMTIRREPLWREVFSAYVRKDAHGRPQVLPPLVADCLLLGTAGLLELRHFAGGVLVNGLLEMLKGGGQDKYVPMVNAILHNVGVQGAEALEKLRRSPRLEDRALWAGVPQWMLPAWKKSWSTQDLNALFSLMQMAPASSLRTANGRSQEALTLLRENGFPAAEPSPLCELGLRLPTTVLPTLVPGFKEGLVTAQSEGSMLVASLVQRLWRRGLILDMCSGRGVKAGQIADSLPAAELELWELSSGRHYAAKGEMKRIGAENRARLRLGNALELEPRERPSLVFLDAPCSGSGTWSRKPESKWKLSWSKLDKICELQANLLRRAIALAAPDGIIIYVTCSLLRQENENVVASVMAASPNCAELEPDWGDAVRGAAFTRRGRPFGTYIWPALPWLDGFYVSIIMKRAEA